MQRADRTPARTPDARTPPEPRTPDRRRFDHLRVELSVACGQPVPRYALWLALHEAGADPEDLERAHALSFCDDSLDGFLAAEGLSLSWLSRRKLRRALRRFDPLLPTPGEQLTPWDQDLGPGKA